jgi:antitoxin VapB
LQLVLWPMYIMYMALHINNPAVEQKVREMASLTGESMTEAIGNAADERIARVYQAKRKQRTPSVDEILALVRSFDLTPINGDLTDDEILGFGPEGF